VRKSRKILGEKSYKILTDSLSETEDGLFNPWTTWSVFGEYLNPITPQFSMNDRYGNMKDVETSTETQENHKNFVIEMMDNFYLATEDYIKSHNLDVDLDAMSINDDGDPIPTWRWAGGTIGKYHVSNEESRVGMNYHSDYIREQGHTPGYKFVITSTIYFLIIRLWHLRRFPLVIHLALVEKLFLFLSF
jgi:hypothetical protein